MKKREYRDYLDDILTSITDVESFISNMTYEDFRSNKMVSNAVIRSMEVIGEASKKIPQSLKNKYPSIQWKKMAGMRDKLIHEYFGVNYEILWKTAKNALPGLKNKIAHVIEEEQL